MVLFRFVHPQLQVLSIFFSFFFLKEKVKRKRAKKDRDEKFGLETWEEAK